MRSPIFLCLALCLTLTSGIAQGATLSQVARQLNLTVFPRLANLRRLEARGTVKLVLAPSDEAFSEVNITGSTLLDRTVLSYHLLTKALPTTTTVIPTLTQGKNMTVNVETTSTGKRTFYFYGDVTAVGMALDTDCLPATNATLCKINRVLKIANSSAYDYIAADPELSTLKEIIDKVPSLAQAIKDQDQVVTIYAPNNNALKNVPALDASTVQELVLGHAVMVTGAPLELTNLKAGTTLEERGMRNNTLTIKATSGVTVTSSGAASNTVNVVAKDGAAGKSLVHVIDAVLNVLDTPLFPASPALVENSTLAAEESSGLALEISGVAVEDSRPPVVAEDSTSTTTGNTTVSTPTNTTTVPSTPTESTVVLTPGNNSTTKTAESVSLGAARHAATFYMLGSALLGSAMLLMLA